MESAINVLGLIVTAGALVAALLVITSMATTKGKKYPKVDLYKLGEKWDHAPLLFSATDIAPLALPSHGHSDGELIGGSASGKW